MSVLCEMYIKDFFRLSSGSVAIIGHIVPDIKNFIPSNSKADLYINDAKIKTINIVGEDRLSGGDESKRQGKRAVRTDSDIPNVLDSTSNAKLVIYG